MRKLFDGAYDGASVFLTGHTGFKGAWMALWLAELGAKVTAYALPPETTPNLFDEAGVVSRVKHIEGDIRDREALYKALHDAKPEFVFHLAAQAIVRRSYDDPIDTFETNVMGTSHLLNALRDCGSVRSCVVVTSDKCYENLEWPHGYRETDAMGGFDPYSASKGCTELVTASFRRSYFHPEEYGKKHHVAIASARAGNVIGGGDWAESRIIPDFVRALSQGETLVLRNPGAIRPWQHVLEPLSGYLLLGARLKQLGIAYADGWNFGPMDAEPLSVERLVKQALEVWGSGNYIVESDGHPHEAHWLQLDIGKARAELQWRPLLNASEAIERTLSWYRAYYDELRGSGLQAACIQEIADYAGRMDYAMQGDA